jgi:hypothetical protein
MRLRVLQIASLVPPEWGFTETAAKKPAGFCTIKEATEYAMQNLGLKQGEFKVLKGRGVDIDGGPKGKWILKVKTEFETHKAGSGKT